MRFEIDGGKHRLSDRIPARISARYRTPTATRLVAPAMMASTLEASGIKLGFVRRMTPSILSAQPACCVDRDDAEAGSVDHGVKVEQRRRASLVKGDAVERLTRFQCPDGHRDHCPLPGLEQPRIGNLQAGSPAAADPLEFRVEQERESTATRSRPRSAATAWATRRTG
jgi:hypothetical protein